MVKSKVAATLLVLLMIVGSGSTTLADATKPAETQPEPAKVVVIKLNGELREAPVAVDLGVPDIKPNLFWDQLRLIRIATADDSVSGMIILVDQPQLTLAQSQQLVAELKRFTHKGKALLVHADSLTTAGYVLALPADKITVTPGAALWLTGVRMQVLYYRHLMQKLGVDAEFEHIGQYKLAAEPFTEFEPSQAMITQLNELVGDVYDQIATEISSARDLPLAAVKAAIDEGPFIAEQAVKAKLIDEVAHRDDFLVAAEKDLAGELIFDYGRAKMPKLKSGFAGLVQLFTLLGAKPRAAAKNKVAVVPVIGMLMEGDSEEFFGSTTSAGTRTLRRAFKQINSDSSIKAVVMRLDTPGGSSTASDVVWKLMRSTVKLKKPVVASMSTKAGSGGYWVACAADEIFAAPATLTGSIGVVAGKPVFDDLLGKLGVVVFSVARGKNADMFDPYKKFSQSQREALAQQITDVFDVFTERVRQGRGARVADVSAVATGKVFTGVQAQKLGLVDQIGTLADAVEWAADKAGIGDDYDVVFMPHPKTLFETILEEMGYQIDGDRSSAAMGLTMLAELTRGGLAGNMLNMAGVGSSLVQVELVVRILADGDPLALAPFSLDIR